jgi:DNA-binding NarL/FixJ family response regulator
MSRAVKPAVPSRPSIGTRPAPATGSALFCEQAWNEIRRSLKLSDRELEIVRRTFDNEKEIIIAAELGIAPRTVHTHLERLHRKLEVTSRSELLVRIMQEFLTLTVCPDKNLPPVCANHATGRCPLRL